MKRHGIDVVVATQNLYGGTSACSGSDKQTLHTAATGRHGGRRTEAHHGPARIPRRGSHCRQPARTCRDPMRRSRHRGGRSGRTLSRQRLPQALLRRPGMCARGGLGGGQSDGKSVRDQHAAGWISLESVGNIRAVHALHP
ncbi:hypothetical protein, partial [Bradyrhizobium sp.]|uniref:hypothetical protein n=1 Tax=Bradyrhizobium sp. TaxID=376 RepID=UPI003C70270E